MELIKKTKRGLGLLPKSRVISKEMEFILRKMLAVREKDRVGLKDNENLIFELPEYKKLLDIGLSEK